MKDNPQIEFRDVESLAPYARNARTHSEAQIAQIVRSIEEFGWTNPVLVDGSGIVAGHGRTAAAKQLYAAGKTLRLPSGTPIPPGKVPTLDCSGWSEAKRRAYIIADNKLPENAGWDNELLAAELGDLRELEFDLSLLGFEPEELDDLLDVPQSTINGGLTDPDQVPPVEPQATTRSGDLWLLGKHRLLCGDSTNGEHVARVMNGERAQLFATDPPYLVNYNGLNHPSTASNKGQFKDWSGIYEEQGGWDDEAKGAQFYIDFCQVAVDIAIDPDAAWYCWHASRRQAMLESVWEKFGAFVHQQIIWAKTRPVLTYSVYMWQHEPCFFGWVKGKKPRVVRRPDGGFEKTLWAISSSEVECTEHPTSKPVRLFTIPIEMHTLPGEALYEPFAGSGSQFIAAEQTDRRCYGLELAPIFCDVIVRRWQQFSGHDAVLECDGRTFDELRQARIGSEQASTETSEEWVSE